MQETNTYQHLMVPHYFLNQLLKWFIGTIRNKSCKYSRFQSCKMGINSILKVNICSESIILVVQAIYQKSNIDFVFNIGLEGLERTSKEPTKSENLWLFGMNNGFLKMP